MKLVGLFLVAALGVALADHPVRSTAPIPIHRVTPEYTKEASDAKVQGRVLLSAVVGVDGTATDIRVVQGLGMGLDQKAIECLDQWRFKPGTRDGQSIPLQVQVQINFSLLGQLK